MSKKPVSKTPATLTPLHLEEEDSPACRRAMDLVREMTTIHTNEEMEKIIHDYAEASRTDWLALSPAQREANLQHAIDDMIRLDAEGYSEMEIAWMCYVEGHVTLVGQAFNPDQIHKIIKSMAAHARKAARVRRCMEASRG